MRKCKVICFFVAINILLGASSLSAKSWVCDTKASNGFNSDRGFEPLNFLANSSYIFKHDIDGSELTLEHQRDSNVFNRNDRDYYPSSIKQIGHNATELCTHIIVRQGKFKTDRITCDTIFYGDVIFNVEIGRFSIVNNAGFTTNGSSYVEVGECRLVN